MSSEAVMTFADRCDLSYLLDKKKLIIYIVFNSILRYEGEIYLKWPTTIIAINKFVYIE